MKEREFQNNAELYPTPRSLAAAQVSQTTEKQKMSILSTEQFGYSFQYNSKLPASEAFTFGTQMW